MVDVEGVDLLLAALHVPSQGDLTLLSLYFPAVKLGQGAVLFSSHWIWLMWREIFDIWQQARARLQEDLSQSWCYAPCHYVQHILSQLNNLGWFTNGYFHHTVTFAYLAWSNLHHRKGNFRLHSSFFAIEKKVFAYIAFSWYKCHWILTSPLLTLIYILKPHTLRIHSTVHSFQIHFSLRGLNTLTFNISVMSLNTCKFTSSTETFILWNLASHAQVSIHSHSKRIDQDYSSLRG